MNFVNSIIVLCFLLIATACDADNQGNAFMQPPLKPGQTLDPESMYAKTWPGKPALVKLKDNLILAIPPQHHEFWAHRDSFTGRDLSFRPPYPVEKLPYADLAGFTMHMPDFGGFTPDNYLIGFDKNRVEVAFIAPASMNAKEPDAPGRHPPNAFKRISTGPYRSIDTEKFQDKYGLRCYAPIKKESDGYLCYGRRESEIEEYILLDIMLEPYEPHHIFPMMTTKYFSVKYGGVDIAWRSHMNNWPRWKEIDAQIWKYIDAWNIAPKVTPPVAPTFTPKN